jgi:hypothetical protein
LPLLPIRIIRIFLFESRVVAEPGLADLIDQPGRRLFFGYIRGFRNAAILKTGIVLKSI